MHVQIKYFDYKKWLIAIWFQLGIESNYWHISFDQKLFMLIAVADWSTNHSWSVICWKLSFWDEPRLVWLLMARQPKEFVLNAW